MNTTMTTGTKRSTRHAGLPDDGHDGPGSTGTSTPPHGGRLTERWASDEEAPRHRSGRGQASVRDPRRASGVGSRADRQRRLQSDRRDLMTRGGSRLGRRAAGSRRGHLTLPVVLASADGAAGREERRSSSSAEPRRQGPGALRCDRYRVDGRQLAKDVLPHRRSGASRRPPRPGAGGMASRRPRHRRAPSGPGRVPRLSPRPRPHARHHPGARLANGRRVPDPEPDPSCPRVHLEVRPRAARWPLHPSARRRDAAGRRSIACAPSLLRGPDRRLLPEGAHPSRRPPRHDALRRPARSRLPRAHPQELRLHPLHRRARSRGTERDLQTLRSAENLRRVRPRRPRHHGTPVRGHASTAPRAAAWRRARPARTPPSTISNYPAPACARCSRGGRCSPRS